MILKWFYKEIYEMSIFSPPKYFLSELNQHAVSLFNSLLNQACFFRIYNKYYYMKATLKYMI